MNLSSYIVIAYDDEYSVTGGGKYPRASYTVEGATIFPFGQILPIIKSGLGCIGLAKVKAFTVRETSTTVQFDIIEKGDPKNYAQIYGAYRAGSGASNSSDSDDAFIPGLHRSKPASTPKYRKPTRSIFDDEEESDKGSSFTQEELLKIIQNR